MSVVAQLRVGFVLAQLCELPSTVASLTDLFAVLHVAFVQPSPVFGTRNACSLSADKAST
jgi:hypothetical protein